MNKLTKLLSVFVIAGTMSAGASFAAGCGHKHSFSSEWTPGEDTHWHAANCGHDDLKGNEAPHIDENNNYICDVCEADMIKKHVTGVSLDVTKKTLKIGATIEFTLTATVAPADADLKDVSWSSDNTAVATVAGGKVTALKAGTANITVTTKDGSKTATCKVTVEAADQEQPVDKLVTNFALSETSKQLKMGETTTFTLTISNITPADATNKDSVVWQSSDEEVATVENGNVTALKAGTVTITAKIGTVEKTCEVTIAAADQEVPEDKLVTDFALSETSKQLKMGETTTFTLTISNITPADATNKDSVVWQSSDEEVATVENGNVTALKAGTVTITAKIGTVEKTCEVTVAAADQELPEDKLVTNFELSETSKQLKMGETTTFTLTISGITPADATNKDSVVWQSSDEEVATVENGEVTALKAGTVTITAKIGTVEKTCEVTIAAADQEVPEDKLVTNFELSETSKQLKMGETTTFTLTISNITPADATNKDSVVWQSSDEEVATVENGEVTALKAGTVTITAKIGTVEKTCEVTIAAAEQLPDEEKLVTDFTLSETSKEVNIGETTTFTLTISNITPADATNKDTVVWQSSDEEVATVENGKVTLLKDGTVTITAKIGTVEKTCEVTVIKEQLTLEQIKEALTATKTSLNYTAYITGGMTQNERALWAQVDESNSVYYLAVAKSYYTFSDDVIMYYQYDGQDNKWYKDEMPKDSLGIDTFAKFVDVINSSPEMGITGFVLDLALGITEVNYDADEDTYIGYISLDMGGGVQKLKGVFTFADGKVATMDIESLGLIEFEDFGTTDVDMTNINSAVKPPLYNRLGSLDKQYIRYDENNKQNYNYNGAYGELSGGLWATPYGNDINDETVNYVEVNQDSEIELIDKGKGETVLNWSFGLYEGGLEGCFTTRFISPGNSWTPIRFVDSNGTEILGFRIDSGVIKYRLGSSGTVTACDNDVKSEAKSYAYHFIITADNKLTVKVSAAGADYVALLTEVELPKSVAGVMFVSGNSDSKRMAVKNLAVDGERISVNAYREIALSQLDKLYYGYVGKPAQGEEDQPDYVAPVVGTHVLNAEAITAKYNELKEIISKAEKIDEMQNALSEARDIAYNYTSDAELNKAKEERRTEIQQQYDNMKDAYTYPENKAQLDAIFEKLFQRLDSAKSYEEIYEIIVEFPDDLKNDWQILEENKQSAIDTVEGYEPEIPEELYDALDNLKGNISGQITSTSSQAELDEVMQTFEDGKQFISVKAENVKTVKEYKAEDIATASDKIREEILGDDGIQIAAIGKITNAETQAQITSAVAAYKRDVDSELASGDLATYRPAKVESLRSHVLGMLTGNPENPEERDTTGVLYGYDEEADAVLIGKVMQIMEEGIINITDEENYTDTDSIDAAHDNAIERIDVLIAADKLAKAQVKAKSDLDDLITAENLTGNNSADAEIKDIVYYAKQDIDNAEDIDEIADIVKAAKEEIEDIIDELNSTQLEVTFSVSHIDGNTPAQIKLVDFKGTVAAPDSVPTYEDKVIVGWSTTTENQVVYDFDTPVLNDLTLYPIVVEADVVFTFKCGVVVLEKQYTYSAAAKGEWDFEVPAITFPTAPASDYDNLMFGYWYASDSTDEPENPEEYVIPESFAEAIELTIYAKYVEALEINDTNSYTNSQSSTGTFVGNDYLKPIGTVKDNSGGFFQFTSDTQETTTPANALSITFKGTGTLTFAVRTDKEKERVAFGVMNAEGEKIATTTELTGKLKNEGNNLYSICGKDFVTISFNITEAGTYTIFATNEAQKITLDDEEQVKTANFRVKSIVAVDNYKIPYIKATEVTVTPAGDSEWAENYKYDVSAGTLALTATVNSNATYQTVTWTSSNPEVATVDENGLVTFIKKGNVTITATSYGEIAYKAIDLIVADAALDANIAEAKTNLQSKYPESLYMNEEYNGATIGEHDKWDTAMTDGLAAIDAATTQAELTAAIAAAETELNKVAKTADLKKTRYDVKFFDGDNEYEDYAIKVAEGDAVVKPTAPTKDGYVFKGWFADADFTAPFKFKDEENAVVITGETSIYAKFVRVYTVKFISVDGETETEEKVLTVEKAEEGDTTVSEPTDLVKKGFNLDGYYTDKACTEIYDFSTDISGTAISVSKNIYFKWVEKEKEKQTLIYSQKTEASDNEIDSTDAFAAEDPIMTGNLVTVTAETDLTAGKVTKDLTGYDVNGAEVTKITKSNYYLQAAELGKDNNKTDLISIAAGEKAVKVKLLVISGSNSSIDTSRKGHYAYKIGDGEEIEVAFGGVSKKMDIVEIELKAGETALFTVYCEETGNNKMLTNICGILVEEIVE